MTGVSDANRKVLTFSLINKMRDFTHERFDYVQNQDDVKERDKSDVHPVLEGGVGASLSLENGWMIEQSIFTRSSSRWNIQRRIYPSEASHVGAFAYAPNDCLQYHSGVTS